MAKGIVTAALVGFGVLLVGAGIASASKDKGKGKGTGRAKPPTGNVPPPGTTPVEPPGPDDTGDDSPETPEGLENDYPNIYQAAVELRGLIGTRTRKAAYRKRALVELIAAWLDTDEPENVEERETDWLADIVQSGSSEAERDIALISQAEWILNNSNDPATLREWAVNVQPAEPELAGALRSKAGEIEIDLARTTGEAG